jgi:NTE family protein
MFTSELIGQQRPKVGLVLSGGGAAGLAHIGAIKVLEEAGIQIDYVAGTSMGSLVGGLFAMGYTAAEMEKVVKDMDWESLLADGIPRSDLTFEYKEQLEKYFYDFPINQGKLQLPTGLIAGTNITNMLAGLSWPAYNIKLFNQLPRPFLCIGADVVTGQEVVLKSGTLHDALRASMAIPTVFTPVEVNGTLLIDGGFINNFPADHLKAMGADIIIGIDVQRELYKKNEIHSVISILKQISTLTREDINAKNRLLCDILIRPRTWSAGCRSNSRRICAAAQNINSSPMTVAATASAMLAGKSRMNSGCLCASHMAPVANKAMPTTSKMA